MTERYGPGHGDEARPRPSGRGAVTERLARRDDGAREIDLTDEASPADAGDDTVVSPAARPDNDQADRESSGAFEPAAPAAAPAAEATRTGSSIFDLDERAKQEDLNRTGYEPAVADADPDGPRGETTVTEPGATQPDATQPDATEPVDTGASDDAPAPAPVADHPADAAPAADSAPAAATPAADTPGSLLGSLDTADIRNRFLDIQAGFIDEPRQAVEQAGTFVDELVKQVADALHQQRGQLTGASAEASTEDLRLALRAYRRFVDRLLGLGN